MRAVLFLGIFAAHVALAARFAPAIEVVIDYRYDTANFFDATTANGSKARATIEAAADFFSNLITDSLAAIPYTNPYTPDAQNTPVWRQSITHPGTGQTGYEISSAANASQDGFNDLPPEYGYSEADEYRDIQIAANQFLIYAGGSSLAVSGLGGTGVAFYGSETFNNLIDQRGKPTGEYSTWGGFVTFDNDGDNNWHYDYTTNVVPGRIDFYSVALHEIGHVLGLNGNNAEWNQYQVGSEWQGPQALAAWIAQDPNAPPTATGIPTESSADHHWDNSPPGMPQVDAVQSYVLGTTTLQESAMDPRITVGERKLFTYVDALALADLGWDLNPAMIAPPSDPADFSGNGTVDGADLAMWEIAYGATAGGDANGDGLSNGADLLLWQRAYAGQPSLAPVPEPAAWVLATIVAIAAGAIRRRAAT